MQSFKKCQSLKLRKSVKSYMISKRERLMNCKHPRSSFTPHTYTSLMFIRECQSYITRLRHFLRFSRFQLLYQCNYPVLDCLFQQNLASEKTHKLLLTGRAEMCILFQNGDQLLFSTMLANQTLKSKENKKKYIFVLTECHIIKLSTLKKSNVNANKYDSVLLSYTI